MSTNEPSGNSAWSTIPPRKIPGSSYNLVQLPQIEPFSKKICVVQYTHLDYDCVSLCQILQTTGNWYKAELSGVVGFVPQNFIDIHLPSWYQEDYSRSEAQEKLMSQPAGTFIIRGSQNGVPGDFSISVRNGAAKAQKCFLLYPFLHTPAVHLHLHHNSNGRAEAQKCYFLYPFFHSPVAHLHLHHDRKDTAEALKCYFLYPHFHAPAAHLHLLHNSTKPHPRCKSELCTVSMLKRGTSWSSTPAIS
ncbi:GRB2-related adapter protein-like [Larimichthys crocea]|uniref:GRB2-related adapter protein-like n=1 Tax=Larimichthys crocea TaxID=215358 RepID=A0A6G0JAA8_LARCR|nr:GRB2-related adapter protein-like [Larimichthys crocea]